MYKNFYSAQGEVVFGSPTQSRLIAKPRLLGVLHGGGLIFENDQDPNVRLIQYWITHPMPAGQDEFSTRRHRLVYACRPEHRHVQHPMRILSVACRLAGAYLHASLRRCASRPARSASRRRARPMRRLNACTVTDPYLELRTGPGRGFPIFFVAARNEWVEIELRHTDWFKVRTANGKVGWVHRRQLETTLTEAGGKKTFRDLMLDDYLQRRVQLGAAWGRFKSEPMLKMWTSYKLSDTLTAEGTIGQVQGLFSGTDFWHVNVTAEPWSDQRLSPFFGIGFGSSRTSRTRAWSARCRPTRSSPTRRSACATT